MWKWGAASCLIWVSLPAWPEPSLDSVAKIYQQSKFFTASQRAVESAEKGMQAAVAPLPLRVQAEVNGMVPRYGNKEETLSSGAVPLEHSEQGNVALVYEHLTGWSNTLRGGVSRNQYTRDAPRRWGANYEVTDRLDYDVIQGGTRANAWLQSQSQERAFRQQRLDAIARLNSEFTQFFQLVLNYAATECKLQNFLQLEGVVKSTLQKGRALLSVNAISRKDFQNYQASQLSYQQNRMSVQNRRSELDMALRAWGPEVHAAIQSYLARSKCFFDEKISRSTVERTRGVASQVEQFRFLQVELARLAMEQAAFDLKLAENESISSLKPFVEVAATRNEAQKVQDYRFMAGLQWNQDFFRYRALGNIEARVQSLRAREQFYEQQNLTSRAQLQQLALQLENQLLLLETVTANIDNANVTLRILSAERALAANDSLQFFNAVSQRVGLVNSLYDLLRDVEVQAMQLKLLTQFEYLLEGA